MTKADETALALLAGAVPALVKDILLETQRRVLEVLKVTVVAHPDGRIDIRGLVTDRGLHAVV